MLVTYAISLVTVDHPTVFCGNLADAWYHRRGNIATKTYGLFPLRIYGRFRPSCRFFALADGTFAFGRQGPA